MSGKEVNFSVTGGGIEAKIARLKKLRNQDYSGLLNDSGAKGVSTLSAMTPTATGKTASSYSAEVTKTSYGLDVVFRNSNTTKSGVPVPLLIHYGHGTGTGGYVPPRPFLDRAIKEAYAQMKKGVERSMK